MSPRTVPRAPGRRWISAAAAAVLLATLGSVSAAAAASGVEVVASWSVPTHEPGNYETTGNVVSGRHLYRLDLHRRHPSVLVSHALRDGRVRRVAVRVPVPPDAAELTDADSGFGSHRLPELFVAGDEAFAVGTWCTDARSDDGDDVRAGDGPYCVAERSFFVRFSVRTGRVRASELTPRRRVLVAGSRVSEIVHAGDGRRTLVDAVTRRRLLVLPVGVEDVRGAGPFVAWKTRPAADDDTWVRTAVRRRATGARVYDLSTAGAERVAAAGRATVDEATLQPDGALSLELTGYGAGLQPVAVDPRGRIRRVGRRMPHAKSVGVWPGGDRLVVHAYDGADGRRLACSRIDTWITDWSGRRGNDLSTLRVTRGFERDYEAPTLLAGGTALWNERDRSARRSARTRVTNGLGGLPLTRASAPRC